MTKIVNICLALLIINFTGCATPGVGKGAGAGSGINTVISVETLDNAVELKMSREFTSTFTVYKPSDPYTVIVELPAVVMGDIPDIVVSEKKGISEVKFTEVLTPVQLLKVEVQLESPLTIEPEKLGDTLLLKVAGEAAKAPSSFEAAAMAPEEELPPATSITSLSFSYSSGALRFNVKGNGSMDPQIFTLDGRVVVDVPDVSMEAAVPETVISPVKAVRYGIYDDKVRLVLDMEEDVEFAASTLGDSIIISIPIEERIVMVEEEEKDVAPEKEAAMAEELAPVKEVVPAGEAAAPEEALEEPVRRKYTGKRISLDFQDADIVPIFRFLGDIAGYNVVIHPSVKGKITLKLLNVPWDQALDIILELSNLDKAIEDNILTIAPVDVFAKQKEEEARLRGVRIQAAELMQSAIHLKHIDAQEMKKRLEEAKVLSPRGTTRIDERTNTLIINDVQDSIDKIIADEVPYWDTPEHGTMQVLIEAKIVEVSTESSRTLGIRWGASANQDNFSFINDASTYDVSVNTPPLAAGPTAGAQGGVISVGYTETITVNMSLEALETVSKVKSLANPRVLTIDKQAATIKQGIQIPYSTTSSEGTKIEFKEAVLSLNVTPEIQPNGILKLGVQAKNDTPIPVGTETGINNQEVNTQALVKDGQTLVLGGIYTNTNTVSETRVPWLGRIPILGWFFKNQTARSAPKELLIFITPKVVR